ncbi:MAG: metal-dependent transcriptional regulator [Clostridia bacterium]|nr:metal-dependent transcriptional regulator [Clostridia bacterium]MBQ4638141.1 metal-dependent transcriptional regulator [Clostridia bacterium]
MDLHESGQMYLESILVLSQTKGKVRSIDIVEYMNFSKPSVSRAVGLLKKGGYILVDKDGHINLTETGRQQAEKIYERHRVISDLLMRLGVDEKTASDDACRIEHAISDRSFDAIKDYLVKLGL